MSAEDRSVSRGREHVVSFGRGGAGNMRPSSTSRGPENRESLSQERGRGTNRIQPGDGTDVVPELSPSRSVGRNGFPSIQELGSPDIEPPIHIIHPDDERVSTGRGGAGNIRSRSQSKVRDQPEPHIQRPHPEGDFFSSGRGGAGNIRSRSQSKSPKEEKPHDPKHTVGDLLQKIIHPHS